MGADVAHSFICTTPLEVEIILDWLVRLGTFSFDLNLNFSNFLLLLSYLSESTATKG